MNRRLPILLVLLLASGLVVAGQREAPAPKPRINRNPAFRESLPPGPTLPPDERDAAVPAPDPSRDSSSRPVLPPDSRDNRDVVVPAPDRTTQPNPPRRP